MTDAKAEDNPFDVLQSSQTITILGFETDTHKFRITEHALEDMKEKKDWVKKIAIKIQKGMRQRVNEATGEQWEKSWKAIFEEITGQATLDKEGNT